MGGELLILLDTHVWIWFNLSPERLGPEIRSHIEAGEELAISSISVWETVLAAEKGRLVTDLEPLENARAWLQANPIDVVPVNVEVALLSRSLPFQHEDPADRFIASTAYHLRCQLATADARLAKLPWLSTVL